ncbi:MAG: type II toxin-antitoxin system VapC family toxin [Phycisphaerales bacterium]|nr:type II toxin-antitoxin system VapC family toxin [Phycisphaerales bacterium]
MVLDTNVLIDLLRVRPSPGRVRALAFLDQILRSGETLMTTRFNVAELYAGAELSSDPADQADRIEIVLADYRILDFDSGAARIYGRIEADLRRRGRPSGDFDVLIASTVLSHGQRLLTRNVRHFADIAGLDVIEL